MRSDILRSSPSSDAPFGGFSGSRFRILLEPWVLPSAKGVAWVGADCTCEPCGDTCAAGAFACDWASAWARARAAEFCLLIAFDRRPASCTLSSNSNPIRLRWESMVLACSTTSMVSRPYETTNKATSTGSSVRLGLPITSSPVRFHKTAPRSPPRS